MLANKTPILVKFDLVVARSYLKLYIKNRNVFDLPVAELCNETDSTAF